MWTDMQTNIIMRTHGDTVVVASPGSGKTTVLTEHIVHQLQTRSVDPRTVVLITYTRQAAQELKSRLAQSRQISERMLAALRVGTFHSEAFRMLLQESVKVPPVLGTHQQYGLLQRILHEEGFSDPVHVTSVSQALTKSKSTWPETPVPKKYRRVVYRYEAAKNAMSRWDYDDILQAFCRRLELGVQAVPPVHYLLVDEFQDTNQVQWSIVCAFQTLWKSRLFVVGDDDQSIYTFRGASPQWLQEASSHTDTTETFLLTRNFRSDRNVVTGASNLILNNERRIPKPFDAFSYESGWCAFTRWPTEYAEADAISTLIESLRRAEPTWRIAVLARTRRQLLSSFTFEKLKKSHGIVEWQTFHGAKGKEWDAVIIAGAVDNNPYLREVVEDKEEERRLFYVAMTRARHSLWISCPTHTERGKARPAKFVFETRIDEISPDIWMRGVH